MDALSPRPLPIVPITVVLPREQHPPVEPDLIKWANGHLPGMQITSQGSICSRVELLQIAHSIKNMRSFNASDSGVRLCEYDDGTLEGLFGLVDLLLDKEVETGAADVDLDVCRGYPTHPSRDKVIQLLKALRTWEQRRAIEQSIEKSPQKAGPSAAQ
jgi:hypothetical protein